MSNAVPSRFGQINAAGDPDALFLKVFAGEVLTAFGRESAFRPRTMTRVISSGKSAQFPATGRASAFYHAPGAEVLGGVIKSNERLITIDDLLIAPVFIANIDELKSHFDVRGIYSTEIGQALAKAFDINVGRVSVINARNATPNTDDLVSGGHDNNASYDTDGTVLWKGIFNAGVQLDTKDVPNQDRSAFVRPVQYALVVQSGMPIDIHYNAMGDNGTLARGDIKMINSIDIVKTNNLPGSDDSANADIPTARRHDYSVTRGLIQHRNAVGTVQLQDVTMESEYQIARQGHLMVGKYLVGHGDLRPEAGYELRTADPAS